MPDFSGDSSSRLAADSESISPRLNVELKFKGLTCLSTLNLYCLEHRRILVG